MAAKRTVKRLQTKALQRKPQQGLPIINQLMENNKPRSASNAIEVAATWMTDNELTTFAKLCVNEGEFVTCHVTGPGQTKANTVKELLEQFGILGDTPPANDDMYGIAGMSPVDALIKVLEENSSWGEFIGGCVAALPRFRPTNQRKIRPHLLQAIRIAAREGVDH